jgi:hypothetical protein
MQIRSTAQQSCKKNPSYINVYLQYNYIEKICTRNLSRLSVGAGNILGLPEEQEIFPSVQGGINICKRAGVGRKDFQVCGGDSKYFDHAGKKQEIFLYRNETFLSVQSRQKIFLSVRRKQETRLSSSHRSIRVERAKTPIKNPVFF